MRKLLSANFARLWRDKFFQIAAAAVFLISLACIWIGDRSIEELAQRGFIKTLDDYYYTLAPYMGLIYAAFISLFLGTEYSDGTMRNKLTVGHTRTHVYLANFLTCFGACLIFAALWFLGGLPGLFLIGPFAMGSTGFLVYLLVAVGFTAVFAALFTWISALSTNKALTLVFTFLVWLGMIFVSSGLNDRLTVPETQGGMVYIDGKMVMTDSTPHPLYLTGYVRVICECLLDALPTGQALLMMDAAIEHPARQILFSLLFTVLVTAAGLAAFRGKDVK